MYGNGNVSRRAPETGVPPLALYASIAVTKLSGHSKVHNVYNLPLNAYGSDTNVRWFYVTETGEIANVSVKTLYSI